MIKFFRRKVTPSLQSHPVNLRPVLARALGRTTPEVKRMVELMRNLSTKSPAE